MPLTEPQRAIAREEFFKNGLHLPTRTIVFGTNSFKEDSEVTDADFLDFFKALHILESTRVEDGNEDANLIKIILLTNGGDIYTGFSMYDAIKSCKSPVEIRVIGKCFSSATFVLQAADYRYAYPTTTFMVHGVNIDLPDMNKNDAVAWSAESERLAKTMVDIYASRLKISRAKISKMMDHDTIFNAEEAKKIGLIDDIKESFSV